MPTTLLRPGARALGALLVSAALVGAPSAALAEETPTATPTASATVTPDATATAEPTSTAGPTATATDPATPTTDPSPTATAEPSPSDEPTAPADPEPTASDAPSPTATEPEVAPMVEGGDASRYGVQAAEGPATSTDPVLVGANYLEEELRANEHHFAQEFGGVSYPDYGLTADAVLALAAAGSGQDEATRATSYLAEHVVDYTGFGDPDEIAAGAVAKLLNVAVAQGVDPTAFGGYDLVATLQGRENAQGRFVDQSAYGDYSNTFGQSFAVVGLERATAGASAAAAGYLALQQCPGGGFALSMADAGCTDAANADPDATSMAVQALVLVGGYGTEVGDALDYLTGLQGADGGVGGAGPTASVNANSTGLAGQAFLAGGRTAQARATESFLTDLQFGCDLPVALRGGIAYDQARFDDATAAGADATTSDQDRRSTSQALLALAGVPLGTVTASGADAEAPALACAADPTPTATPTNTTATPTATTDPGDDGAAGAGSDDTETTVPAATAAGALAQTGVDPMLPVLVGVLLLLLGAAAIVASRRRGAHA